MSIYKTKSQSYANISLNSQGTLPVTNGSFSTSYTLADTSTTTGITNIQSTLRVNGDATFDGDIAFKGRSLDETLKKIEERLGILIPNVRLEEDWKELKDLRMQYVELEKQLLEKQRVFDILKKQ
jgi:hypothetical protein